MFTFMGRETLDQEWNKFRKVETGKQSLKIVTCYASEIVYSLEIANPMVNHVSTLNPHS